ncbi:unnamed protein product [Calypogeia fissa]
MLLILGGYLMGSPGDICVSVGLLTVTRLIQFQDVREREVMAILHCILEESHRGNAVNINESFSPIALNNVFTSAPRHILDRKLDKFFDEIIEEHHLKTSMANTANDKEDFLDALLRFGQTEEFDECLSMDSIKALMLDMILASGNTSSATAAWGLSELLKQRPLLRNVQKDTRVWDHTG